MKKNSSNLYAFAIQDQLSQGLTGQTPIVYISKDGGSFAAATNSATEFNASTAPGLYTITFTATECDCDVMIIQVYLPNGQDPAILAVEEMQSASGGGATPQQIWEYAGGRTVTNTIPTAQNIWEYSSRTLTASALTAQQVWEYSGGRTLTASPTDISGLATSTALSDVATNVSAVKAKTDNIPASPAAVGSEMALTSAAISAVQNGLATIAATDALAGGLDSLANYGDAHWSTANVSGLATTAGLESLATYGDNHWTTADVSNIPTAEENAAAVWDAETRTITDSPDIQAELTTYGAAKTSDIPTAQDIWEYPDRELTSEISVEISAQNIADITESVWNADDRTLTDLTPKPNQKSIACTPSDVINSYGITRLENWTNETAGTAVFDEKINTYIVLAKEKMATDLNNHINAAINYIGADNMTELCAWLTGYNLYTDDESTDTDSLPETRYNMYLEQIHRIMENI